MLTWEATDREVPAVFQSKLFMLNIKAEFCLEGKQKKERSGRFLELFKQFATEQIKFPFNVECFKNSFPFPSIPFTIPGAQLKVAGY